VQTSAQNRGWFSRAFGPRGLTCRASSSRRRPVAPMRRFSPAKRSGAPSSKQRGGRSDTATTKGLPNVVRRAQSCRRGSFTRRATERHPDGQPFLSSESIRKGQQWRAEIGGELEASSFGIACLARDNLDSAWIHFEAGAIGHRALDCGIRPAPASQNHRGRDPRRARSLADGRAKARAPQTHQGPSRAMGSDRDAARGVYGQPSLARALKPLDRPRRPTRAEPPCARCRKPTRRPR